MKALLADALEDLCGSIGMGLQHTDNITFEGLKLAGALCYLSWPERCGTPFSDRSRVQGQFCGYLGQ